MRDVQDYRVLWSDNALAEIEDIIAYVEMFDPAAAVRLAQRLIDAGNALSVAPFRGPAIRSQVRKLSAVYPYHLRYRVIDGTVEIVAVRHGARSRSRF